MHTRIGIDPNVCHGHPVIRNTRVLVANILADLAAGQDYDEVIGNYPGIEKEDIKAALAYGSSLAMFETVAVD